jgi:hypothetical protein
MTQVKFEDFLVCVNQLQFTSFVLTLYKDTTALTSFASRKRACRSWIINPQCNYSNNNYRKLLGYTLGAECIYVVQTKL